MVNIRNASATPRAERVVRVRVGSKVATYRENIAGLGDHLANSGRVLGLTEAQRQAARLTASGDFLAATFWVCLDDSGLFYEVEVLASGHHKILRASPTGTIREEYDANGYGE